MGLLQPLENSCLAWLVSLECDRLESSRGPIGENIGDDVMGKLPVNGPSTGTGSHVQSHG